MASKDNYLFGKDGNFYRRVPCTQGSLQCRNCQLPSDHCSRVKCIEKNRRFFWIKDEEMLQKFLEQLTPEDFDKLVHNVY